MGGREDTGNQTLNIPTVTRSEPSGAEPTVPNTPTRFQGNRSFSFRTPVATSTPSQNGGLGKDEYVDRSELVTSPPEEVMPTPRIVPAGTTTSPGTSIQEKQVRIHPELRSYNKPGSKEALVDPLAPRATRSGKQYGV